MELFGIEESSTTFLVTSATAILLLVYLLTRKQPRNYPPGPVGLPFVGYLPFLGDNAAETLRKLKPKYGSIMSVQIGLENWIILNEYQTIHECFVRQSSKFSGRPKKFMLQIWPNGSGIINKDYGNEYKTLKKFGLTAMREFGVGKIGIEENAIEEASFLIENLATKNNLSLHSKVSLAVSNIICRVAFGSRLCYDDKKLNTMLNSVKEIFSDSYASKMFGMLTAAPVLRYIPPFNRGLQDIVRLKTNFLDVLRVIVDEHKKSYDENTLRDVIDTFLKKIKSRGGSDATFWENQLSQFIRDIFQAGTGATSTVMLWCFLCFVNYPQSQEKIYNEIQHVIENKEIPRMKHRDKMPYTCAFIQEILRHRTLSPLGVLHKTTNDATVNGYTIPKDTTVIANIWAVHHDPDLFKNPTQFRPERFLDEDGKFMESNYMIPFSIGPRHCIGQQIAKVELFIFLTKIVQNFKVIPKLSSPAPLFSNGTYSMITYNPPAFEVEFEKR